MIRRTSLLLLGLLIVAGILVQTTHKANAVSGADWQAGRIIDDSIFTNKNAMSVSDVQAFLNKMVGTNSANGTAGVCDTNGLKQSELGGGTRSQYGAAHSNPTPFTCLKDYYEVPKTSPGAGLPASNYGGSMPSGAISAAQIIWNAAQQYNINPQVLLVTLQKESAGPLVTDDWPLKSQYTYAMGAHCPDSTGCDPNYAGFSIQISESAALFRYYLDNITQPWWPYKKLGANNVLFNPSSACGFSSVNVQSLATAALYTYTPYQPNPAALNNMYGLGDACSAYGNRNFWRTFNDWFDPRTIIYNTITMRTVTAPDTNPVVGQTVSYVVSFTNNTTADLPVDAIGIVGRLNNVNNGASEDFGWVGPVTLGAGATQQYTFTKTIHDIGTIYAWPAINYRGTYIHYNNWGTALGSHTPNLSLSAPLTSTVTNPVAGQTTTLSATIKNNESQAITLDSFGIPVRYYDKYNYDTGWSSTPVTIQPGATQLISGDLTFNKTGTYTAWVTAQIGGQFTSLLPALNFNAAVATPNFQLTYVQGPDMTPALGEDVTLRYKLKNNSGVPMTLDAIGVVGRYDNPYTGANNDFGWVGPDSFTAGQEKTYAFTANVSQVRNFYAWVAINYKGRYIHYNNWGMMLTPHMVNLSLSAPLTINSGAPAYGVSNSVTANIKNNEPYPIKYGAVGIPARYYGAYNYDTGWQGTGTLAASGQAGDSVTVSGTINFNKHGPYTVWLSILVGGQYITIGNQQNLNL